MKTSFNDRGDEVTEWLWETEDTAGGGAAPREAAEAGDTAAAPAVHGKSSAPLKERQEPGAGAGKEADGAAKKPIAKKASGAAAAKGSTKVSGSLLFSLHCES